MSSRRPKVSVVCPAFKEEDVLPVFHAELVRIADQLRGLYAFGALDRVKEQLTRVLQAPVDVVPEPAEPGPLKAAIDRDRCLAF